MSGKYALIIGNTEHVDPGLSQLTAPGKDAEDFARVLKDKEIGAFDDVRILLNELSSTISEAIDDFFDQKKPDDLLVLYFSGHGVRDELGSLYLAVRNTIRSRLRSTAIKSDYIREVMDSSRSKRQVLILDCCNSGAVAQGTKAATGVSLGTATAFESGFGRIILTASDSTQFAWEGDKVIGETDNSLFTHYLVEGLKGEADNDGDGRITVDELYDYAYKKVRLATPKQTPSKFSTKQQGEIVLRQSTRIEDIKPVPLPADLIDEIEDTRPYVREAAVQKLEKILKGKNIGLSHSAKAALVKIIADENTTRRVAQSATQALESVLQTEPKLSGIRIPDDEDNHLTQAMPELHKQVTQEISESGLELVKAGTLRTVISQRTLVSLIISILIVFTISICGYYYLLQMKIPEPTPAIVTTEKHIVPVFTLTDNIQIPTSTVTRIPSQTPKPSTTPLTESYVYIAVSKALLYKGPALEYGLVNQTPYPRGEKFTIIARNSSGLWLLCKASDGIEGWLYLDWLDIEIDPLIISTASSIPPFPATPTRQPKNSGPTPTCVFC